MSTKKRKRKKREDLRDKFQSVDNVSKSKISLLHATSDTPCKKLMKSCFSL